MPIIYIGEGEASKIINNNSYGWSFRNNDYVGVNKLLNEINSNNKHLTARINSIKNNFKKKFDYDSQFEMFNSNIKL